MAINWKTILSVFDGKPTLLQYLKKVLKALEETALNGFRLNYNENTQALSVSAIFADGQEIASEPITLNIPSAETILEAMKENEYSLVSDPSSLDGFGNYNKMSIRVDYPDGEYEIFSGINLWEWLVTNAASFQTQKLFVNGDIIITAADSKHLYANFTQQTKQLLTAVNNYLISTEPRNLKTPLSAPAVDSLVLVNTANAQELAPVTKLYCHEVVLHSSYPGDGSEIARFYTVSERATPYTSLTDIFYDKIYSFGNVRGVILVNSLRFPEILNFDGEKGQMFGRNVWFNSDIVTPFMIGE